MNREDFKDKSIEQLIFDYWSENIDLSRFEEKIYETNSDDLARFIVDTQSKGWFGQGKIHP